MKKRMALLVGMLAVAFAGAVRAETRLAVQDSTGTVDKMVVTDTGFVGVGTNLPFSSLHMIGPTNAAAQVLTHTTYTSAGGGGSFIGLHNNASGALPISGDRLGYFYFGTKSGTNYRLGGGMSVYAEGPWTDTSWPTAFKFETASATTAPAVSSRIERMRINSEGNVGIGTTVPKQKLEINGGIRLNSVAVKPTCSSTTRGTLWFEQGTTDVLYVCSFTSGTPSWKVVTLN